MDAVQINEVVDKVADRIGLAVTELGPISETLVRETAQYHSTMAIGCVVGGSIAMTVTAIGVGVVGQGIKKGATEGEALVISGAVAILVGAALTIVSVVDAVSNFAAAASPSLSLLREVM